MQQGCGARAETILHGSSRSQKFLNGGTGAKILDGGAGAEIWFPVPQK